MLCSLVLNADSHLWMLALLMNTLFSFAHAGSTLTMVNVLYRHGDRSPVGVYPNDPYKLTLPWWPQGAGWLTQIGMEQQYELGRFFRKEYERLLNSTYEQTEIHVESSDEDRCLMSAYCNLAGLYPPAGSQVWNPNITWQPVPVHTRPKEEDNKLYQGAPCPRYTQLFAEELVSEAVRTEERDNAEFYSMVVKNAGVKYENISVIWEVADAIFCERAHNYSLPSWITDEVYRKLQNLAGMSFNLLFNRTEMSRLKGGPLLKDILSNINSSVQGSSSQTYKMFMYSGHDTTVASLLTALQVFNDIQPPYAAAVLLELWQDTDSKDHFVFLRYRNDSAVEPYNLTVPGCGGPLCPLANFVTFAETRIPGDWNAECGNTTPASSSQADSDNSTTTVTGLAAALGITVLLCLSLVVFVFFQRGRRQADMS